MLNPFTPGPTANVAAAAASARVALPGALRGGQVLVTNTPGSSMAFVAFGDATVTADAGTGMPVLPGAAYVLTLGAEATHMAAIAPSGNTTVYVTTGQGN